MHESHLRPLVNNRITVPNQWGKDWKLFWENQGVNLRSDTEGTAFGLEDRSPRMLAEFENFYKFLGKIKICVKF